MLEIKFKFKLKKKIKVLELVKLFIRKKIFLNLLLLLKYEESFNINNYLFQLF